MAGNRCCHQENQEKLFYRSVIRAGEIGKSSFWYRDFPFDLELPIKEWLCFGTLYIYVFVDKHYSSLSFDSLNQESRMSIFCSSCVVSNKV